MSNEFVMVPRELAEEINAALTLSGYVSLPRGLQVAMANPAEQHQDEPVALPERKAITAHGLTALDSEAEGWNACLDEIAKLGPLYTHVDPGEVERLRAEVERLRSGFYQQVTDDDLKKIADFIGDGDLPTKSFFLRPDAANLANVTMHMVREVQAARALLAGRDALLGQLAEAAEVFSCSAHCETSDAGDALELLNTILARVNTLKAPKCRVCGYRLHPDGYCSFRDCGVPGIGTKALSASAEPAIAKQETRDEMRIRHKREFDALDDSGFHYQECRCGTQGSYPLEVKHCACGKPFASAEPSAPVERDERAEFESYAVTSAWLGLGREEEMARDGEGYAETEVHTAWDAWQARAALERKP